jgi:hypothetical protein
MIVDLVKELETCKEVTHFADLHLIMTTGCAGTSGGPFIRPVYSPCLTTHQKPGKLTSSLHHGTGEIEEWT